LSALPFNTTTTTTVHTLSLHDALPISEPNRQGHFDEIEPDDETFKSATAYGAIRCVLDIWEVYLGRRLAWHFGDTYRRLEIIPRSEEHTSELQSRSDLVCRLLLEKKKK